MARGSYVLGRDLVRKTLEKLPKIARANLQTGMTESAEALANNMRARVPVKEGTLRDSIRVEPRKNPNLIGALIKAGGPTTTKPVRNGQSAVYDYSMAIELGTQEQLASPFFFPEYRRAKSNIKRRASKAVSAAVEAAKK